MARKIFGLHIPFIDHLDVQAKVVEPGHVRAELVLRPELMNSWGSAHGGVSMTVMDFAMGMAARSTKIESGGAVTVEMKTSFFAPAKVDFIVEARVLHQSKTLHYCEAEQRDHEGRLLAKALGTFKVLSVMP